VTAFVESGTYAIADFICPTARARGVFGDAFVVWVDRIKSSRFPDTDALFEGPQIAVDGKPPLAAEPGRPPRFNCPHTRAAGIGSGSDESRFPW
jgi:hypothetical protein